MTSAMKRQHQAMSFSLNSDLSTQDEQVISFSKPVARACTECGARNTPQWRQGPQGPQTLCNACGVRYSRLHRKAKAPKKQSNDSPSSPKGSDGHDDDMEDSDGMTVFTQCPVTGHGSPASAPTTLVTPALPNSSFQTTSSVRPTRAVRTGLGPLATQPCSPAAATTNTPSSRRSSSGGAALAPFAKEPQDQQATAPAKPPPDYDLDCEAANMLLSMAAGVPCRESYKQAEPAPGPAPVVARSRDVHAEVVPAQRQRSVESLPAGVERAERKAGPTPCLQPEEVRALQQLCSMFDERFKDLVAARAACDAVARVLRIKQEEARVAQAAARGAAQLLMVHAAHLSNHEAVQRALSLAQAADRDVQALAAAPAVAAAPAPTPSPEGLAGPSTATAQ